MGFGVRAGSSKTLILAVLNGGVAYARGQSRRFGLGLAAQRAPCQLQVKANTRSPL